MAFPLLLAADIFGETSPVTVGLAMGLAAVGAAWGQASGQITGLRERVLKLEQQVEALKSENATIKATASTQGLQIVHVLELLTELRTDVKTLLNRRDDTL